MLKLFVNAATKAADESVQAVRIGWSMHDEIYSRFYRIWSLRAISPNVGGRLLQHETSCCSKTRSYWSYTYLYEYNLFQRAETVSAVFPNWF